MVKSTIDEIKDITLERQIRKLASVIDEQNKKIEQSADYSTDINNLKASDSNQNTEINKLKTTSAVHTTDIDNLKASDANQTIQINNLKQTVATDKLATDSAITALQNKDVEQDGTLTDHSTQIHSITESLVSGVQIMPGTTTGDIKVRLERESAAAIDSNNYNLGLPVSAEIIQGTGPSMFKIQITMSSGVKVVSNDFVFTTEAIGTDVYISSFTFKAGNQTGYLSADIGLNNGVVIEANNFLVPTDPNVTSAITDLQSRLSTAEGKITDIDGLKTTVSEHTSEINTLNSDVADLKTDKADVNNNGQTIVAGTINATNINKNGISVATVNDIPSVPDISGKADLNNSSQTIVAGTINATNINKGSVAVATVNDISGKVNIAQGVENAGKVLGIGADGNVTPVDGGSGGEVWEEVDLSNIAIDWSNIDRVKVCSKFSFTYQNPGSWTTKPSSPTIANYPGGAGAIIEMSVDNTPSLIPVYITSSANFMHLETIQLKSLSDLNSGNLFELYGMTFNGGGVATNNFYVTNSNAQTYLNRLWVKLKS